MYRQQGGQDRRAGRRCHRDHAGAPFRHAAGGRRIEANVATGYHAIEFLLWGAGSERNGPGCPATALHGFRRKACHQPAIAIAAPAYLKARRACSLRPQGDGSQNWTPTARDQGGQRTQKAARGDPYRMGSLSYGRTCGRAHEARLLLHDPEEEQRFPETPTTPPARRDGIQSPIARIYRVDGSKSTAPRFPELVAAKDAASTRK